MENSENVYKIIILESNKRKLFHPKLHDNILEEPLRHKKPSAGIKKCLFGKADPEITKRMLEEQYMLDQQRFFSRFGFDIETIEHLERTSDVKENIENDLNRENRGCNVLGGTIKNLLGRKMLKARRKVTFNKDQAGLSQQFITDFYQYKKSSSSIVEKKLTQQTSTQTSSISLDNC